jgi:hypothetical protein
VPGAATKIEGKLVEIDDKEKYCMVRKEPIGVVGQIVPWNYPLLMMIWSVCSAHCPFPIPFSVCSREREAYADASGR